jgi:predicted DNA-binding transcriptional regulator AlpA
LIRFPGYDLDTAIEVLGAFITSGIRDEVDWLRREVEALKEQVADVPKATAPKPDKERFLNQREAAEFLGCSTGFIRKQALAGEFPEPVKLSSRDLRWARSDLIQWAVARRSNEGAADS